MSNLEVGFREPYRNTQIVCQALIKEVISGIFYNTVDDYDIDVKVNIYYSFHIYCHQYQIALYLYLR